MNSIMNYMSKYDHRQHVLSDWLAELEQRFQLGEVDTDKSKITWCQTPYRRYRVQHPLWIRG